MIYYASCGGKICQILIMQQRFFMTDALFEKKAEFISWCIEMYASTNMLNGRDVANLFADKNVLDFLGEHYEILHTQGKSYILATIEDFIKTRAN